MRSDESIEDWVVEHAEARLIISQMVVRRLIIVVEDQSATTSDNSLGRLSNGQTVDFVQVAVERLHSRERADIPNPDHARDVG